jgi:hypothetical protein
MNKSNGFNLFVMAFNEDKNKQKLNSKFNVIGCFRPQNLTKTNDNLFLKYLEAISSLKVERAQIEIASRDRIKR